MQGQCCPMQTKQGGRSQAFGSTSLQTPSTPFPSLHVVPTFAHASLGCSLERLGQANEADAATRPAKSAAIRTRHGDRQPNMPRAYPTPEPYGPGTFQNDGHLPVALASRRWLPILWLPTYNWLPTYIPNTPTKGGRSASTGATRSVLRVR